MLPRPTCRRLLPSLALVGALLVSAVPAASTPAAGPSTGLVRGSADAELSWVEVFSEDGTISWAQVQLPQAPMTAREAEVLADSGVTLLHGQAQATWRYNLVIVGDGYTADDQDVFAAHAADKVDAILDEEPFATYAEMFNIWAVEVISPESGVDNDPYPGPDVATALDMEFWCNGIERLLCVNQSKASTAASAVEVAVDGVAHDVDHVLVLANSTKYGGAGGTVATSSGGNAAASLVTIHELGHSIGRLADEYEYYARAGLSEDSTEDVTIPAPGLSGLPGQEPGGANITAASSPEELEAQQLKWWRWLGEESPDGGVVATYEGGGYSPVFIYRATEDSLMHTLGIAHGGNTFNLVAIEEMTAAFHRSYDTIAGLSARPADGGPADRVEVAVDLRPLVGPVAYEIRWSVDGQARPEFDDLRTVVVDDTAATATVTVTDPTPYVRDPDLIGDDLTETATIDLG